MSALHVMALGTPAPKGSLRHVGRGRLVEQVKGSAPWRQEIAAATRRAIAAQHWTALDGPVFVDVTVYVPNLKRPRPWPVTRSSGDVDKHARNVLDALADGGALTDDSTVVDLTIRKRYAEHRAPSAVITVRAHVQEG